MNCRTLCSDVRVKELQQLASDMSIDVLAVQEHKRISLDVHESLLPGWQFLFSESPSPGVGGIGFLQSSRAVKSWLFFSFHCHPIGKIVLDVNDRRLNIFCFYAPTAVDNHIAEWRTFHNELSSLVNDIPLRHHILICGDLNAPLSADGCRVKNVCGEPNRNSEAQQEFISLHDLIAANGIMRQKRSRLPTFEGPRGRCTRLDWIFGWSYIALPSTRTDLVMSTRQFQEKSFDFVTALSFSAQISLPQSIAPSRVRSWNNSVELRKARSRVQNAHHKFGKYSSQHSAALERLDRTHAFVAETHAMAIIDDIQSQIYERRTAAAWKSINEFCGRRSTPLSCIKASSIDQVKEKLRQHYANVLNRPPPPSPINDDDDVITVTPELDPSKVTGPITTAELRVDLSTSRLPSSSGPDCIPVIALRIEELEEDILNTINQSPKIVVSDYNIPSHWKHTIIVTIPIKGSSLSLDNQRGIVKSCAISMIQSNILFHRIKSVTESQTTWFPKWPSLWPFD